MSKKTFRPRRSARKEPRYPVWESSRRDFVRALGAAAAGGMLGVLVGCESDPMGIPTDISAPKDMMAEMDLAPKDLGLEAAVDTLAATDSPRDMPAPRDFEAEK